MLLSALAKAVIVAAELVIAFAAHQARVGLRVSRIVSLGYALPGTVLAIGLLWPMALIDDAMNQLGQVSGMVLSGPIGAPVEAYGTRFLAISAGGTMRAIHLPLVRPTLFTAAMLIFVTCMKELPAILLLRPLGFETLATHLYGEAASGIYEDGAIAAVLIVLVPVILPARLSRRGS